MNGFFRSIIDFVAFVVGPFFAAFYLLDFSHGPAGPGPYYYYYRHDSKIGIALALALICLGLVMRSWRKDTTTKSSPSPQKDFRQRPQTSSQRTRKPRRDAKPLRPHRNRDSTRSKPKEPSYKAKQDAPRREAVPGKDRPKEPEK
jgi:hypothetical protein